MFTPKGDINDALLKLAKDEAVVAKLKECKTEEEALAVVKTVAPDMTMEELKSSVEVMKSYIEESESGVLSEDDLDQVAGGKGKVTLDDVEKGFNKAADVIREYSPISALISLFK